MTNHILKRFTIVAFLVIVLPFVLSAKAQVPESEIADTPWPMYQHDPQHTGRSPFLGPTHVPELLWTDQLPGHPGSGYGISIDPNGNLLFYLAMYLFSYNPVSRTLNWAFMGGDSTSVPLIGSDGNIYLGFGNSFGRLTSNGDLDWDYELDGNFYFGSSPTFGLDGNLYFVHDALWSYTPSGNFRWLIPLTDPYYFSHASPAIAPDGTIYVGLTHDMCAIQSDGEVSWCLDTAHYSYDNTPALGTDGTIYLPSWKGTLYAINPSGTIDWEFLPEEIVIEDSYIPNGIAISSEGTIYFAFNNPSLTQYLFAVNPEGKLKWKVPFLPNNTTGFKAHFGLPILVDRAGNSFVCPGNSSCYGIDPTGSVMWEYKFPLEDSISLAAGQQPQLAADGLFYVMDNYNRLYAFADPELYPALTTSYNNIAFQVEPGATSFTTTLPISSTVSPITYTATISPASEWITITHPTNVTPTELTIRFDPATLPSGIYHTNLQVKPSFQAGVWLEIPVTLNVGMKQVFLPVVLYGYKTPYRILYRSYWFKESQLASIEQTGQNRIPISHQIEMEHNLIYSPDGRKVATILYDGNYHIKIMDTTTGQIILNVTDQTIRYADPTWSPDSNQLAFVSIQDSLGVEIYVISLDGTGQKRLTYNQLCETNLFWSPTGDRIAVEDLLFHTYLMDSDGSNFHQLITGHWQDVPLGWSPDGYHLLLNSQADGYSPHQLGVYDLKTGVYTLLTDQFRGQAVWSPDGTRIAYVGWGDINGFDWDIFIVNPDGSDAINLSHVLDKENSQPAWSPDSRWLAFSSRSHDIYNDPNYDIYVVRSNGTDLMQVTANTQLDANPFWKP